MAETDAAPPRSDSVSPTPPETLTLRALVSSKDAGVIIGKGGKNVADLREQTNVKAGVSKVVPGHNERVLSVTGDVLDVAKAYGLIVGQLLEANSAASPSSSTPSAASTTLTLRLLVSHNLMGSIIGRQGLKIKGIQDSTGVRMVASKDMLPQSTERVVEVQGAPEAIGAAVEQIGKALFEDWERGQGTVLYQPGAEDRSGRRNTNFSSNFNNSRRSNGAPRGNSPTEPSQPLPAGNTPQANLRTQNISIPSDMVGCIIGHKGTKIAEIRRLSGSKISIAQTPHDETGERMFTIIGTPESNEKALFLLYNQLESEKERRVGRETQLDSA